MITEEQITEALKEILEDVDDNNKDIASKGFEIGAHWAEQKVVNTACKEFCIASCKKGYERCFADGIKCISRVNFEAHMRGLTARDVMEERRHVRH